MCRYVATVNIPGYMSMEDEPPVFDTPCEAWAYLAAERERGEDETEGENYSETREALAVLGTHEHWQGDTTDWLIGHGLAPEGTGTVYGDTPGYEGDHDLGLAYSVSGVSLRCEATDGLSHSSDLVEVYRGSATPTLLCGKHAQSA